jgi:hypothetical protein
VSELDDLHDEIARRYLSAGRRRRANATRMRRARATEQATRLPPLSEGTDELEP